MQRKISCRAGAWLNAETLIQTTDRVVWVNFFLRFIFNVHISNVIILQRNISRLKPHNGRRAQATRPTLGEAQTQYG